MIRYSFRSGQFDLIADTYTVMRRHGKDLFHIRTKTAPDEDILILSPDCGIGTAKGEWTEDAVPQGMFQTEKLRFCFHTAAGDETTLTFHSDRIEGGTWLRASGRRFQGGTCTRIEMLCESGFFARTAGFPAVAESQVPPVRTALP